MKSIKVKFFIEGIGQKSGKITIKVIEKPELFEQIAVFLRDKEIINSQQLNKGVIELFFKPSPF